MSTSLVARTCAAALLAIGLAVSARAQVTGPEVVAQPRVDPCRATETRSYASYIKPGWATQLQWGTFLVASDPQHPRVRNADGTEGDDAVKSDQILRTWLGTMSSSSRQSDYYVPVFINGDLTEFGHGWQRRRSQDEYFPLLAGKAPGPLFFPGLGNHDYANNVNDCANNGCARDSVCDVVRWVNEFMPTAGSPKYFDYKYSEDKMRGSLSYAFTLGRLFFIQLHDSPVYKVTFKSHVELDGLVGEATYQIDPSLRWLEGVLREARAAGLIIFINVHKTSDWPNDASAERFKQLVQSYQVSAAFGGISIPHLATTPVRPQSLVMFRCSRAVDCSSATFCRSTTT